MTHKELADWLRLLNTPGIGPVAAQHLLAAFGLPADIFRQSSAALEQVVSARQAQALQTPPPTLEALCEQAWQWQQAAPASRCIWSLADPAYPRTLLDSDGPPLLLYAMGEPLAHTAGEALQDHLRHSLGIVGSRNPTPQGARNAHEFAKALADNGMVVVSGLALGIDAAAHTGALASDNPFCTVAFVGTGLDRVYPKQHHELTHRISERGLVLSEYPIGTPPLAAHFPQRNRLIAGISRGTLVVEATLQSGSLITARLANEIGKEVFAIPGSIHAPQARGCHALIKQGAKLVECAQDIVDELPPHTSPHAVPTHAVPLLNEPDPASAPLLQAMGFDPVGLDTLVVRTGLDTPTLQVQLMQLELEQHIARLPGGRYQRLHNA